MTRVSFLRDTKGSFLGYTAKGHSGFSEQGSDIVCAAVSALTQSCAKGILNVVGAKAEYRLDQNGYFEITLDQGQSTEAISKCQILLETLYETLTELSQDERYRNNVRVTITERR